MRIFSFFFLEEKSELLNWDSTFTGLIPSAGTVLLIQLSLLLLLCFFRILAKKLALFPKLTAFNKRLSYTIFLLAFLYFEGISSTLSFSQFIISTTEGKLDVASQIMASLMILVRLFLLGFFLRNMAKCSNKRLSFM